MKIIRIALAGGPGSGKTSVLKHLEASVRQQEKTAVVFLPETATFHFTHRGKGLTEIEPLPVRQHYIYSSQLLSEEVAIRTADASAVETLILISDRGMMDLGVYLEPGDVKKASGLSELPFSHYDMVIYLSGGADISSDDTFRIETADARLKNEQRAYEIWKQTEKFCPFAVIPQKEQIDDKLLHAKEILNDFLGREIFV